MTPQELMKGTILEQLSPQVKGLIEEIMVKYAIHSTKDAMATLEKMRTGEITIGMPHHPSLGETVTVSSNDGNGKHW